MSLDHLAGDEAALGAPAGRRLEQHMHDAQVEPAREGIEILAAGDPLPDAVAVEERERAIDAVASVRRINMTGAMPIPPATKT